MANKWEEAVLAAARKFREACEWETKCGAYLFEARDQVAQAFISGRGYDDAFCRRSEARRLHNQASAAREVARMDLCLAAWGSDKVGR